VVSIMIASLRLWTTMRTHNSHWRTEVPRKTPSWSEETRDFAEEGRCREGRLCRGDIWLHFGPYRLVGPQGPFSVIAEK